MTREIITVINANPNGVVKTLAGSVLYSRFVASKLKEFDDPQHDLLHTAVGISGEAGELLDAVKKHWAYEQPLNTENVIEELGDLFFYMTGMMIVLGLDYTAVLQANVEKLEKRYLKEFTAAEALTRTDTKEPTRMDAPWPTKGDVIGRVNLAEPFGAGNT